MHGLISTPFDWAQTINGLQADPEIRKHYQFWVFGYPTGNPILYSALRLREELGQSSTNFIRTIARIVVVGHSMGGMLTRMQVITVTKPMWEKGLGKPRKAFLEKIPAIAWLCVPQHFRLILGLNASCSFVLRIAGARWPAADWVDLALA